MNFDELLLRANTEEKTLLYFMNHKPFSPKPMWKNLVPLDIRERAWILVSIGMQKDSELLELFNRHILKLLETGVIERLRRKWLIIPGYQVLLGLKQAFNEIQHYRQNLAIAFLNLEDITNYLFR